MVACSFDVEIVDAMLKYFMKVFHPLSRPPDEHEVELPGVIDGMRSQLLECKVMCLSLAPGLQHVITCPRSPSCLSVLVSDST